MVLGCGNMVLCDVVCIAWEYVHKHDNRSEYLSVVFFCGDRSYSVRIVLEGYDEWGCGMGVGYLSKCIVEELQVSIEIILVVYQ